MWRSFSAKFFYLLHQLYTVFTQDILPVLMGLSCGTDHVHLNVWIPIKIFFFRTESSIYPILIKIQIRKKHILPLLAYTTVQLHTLLSKIYVTNAAGLKR